MIEFMEEKIKMVSETVEGYHVKNLRWKKIDKIITGQVKCPVIGRSDLYDGYIGFAWDKNGKPLKRENIGDRKDLILKFNINE